MEKTAAHNKQDIAARLSQDPDSFRVLGVKKLGLFGSFAREDQGVDSDVDLLVEFEPDRKTFDNFMELSFLLEDLMGREVELVTIESLSPYIGPRVLEEVEYVFST